MKTNKKTSKQLAVVFIMGLALLYNMEIRYSKQDNAELIKEKIENMAIESNKEDKNSKIAVFIQSIIKTGLKQIISNH